MTALKVITPTEIVMYVLIGAMFIILFSIFILRIVKPAGLTAPPPPQPVTENITIENSESD